MQKVIVTLVSEDGKSLGYLINVSDVRANEFCKKLKELCDEYMEVSD